VFIGRGVLLSFFFAGEGGKKKLGRSLPFEGRGLGRGRGGAPFPPSFLFPPPFFLRWDRTRTALFCPPPFPPLLHALRGKKKTLGEFSYFFSFFSFFSPPPSLANTWRTTPGPFLARPPTKRPAFRIAGAPFPWFEFAGFEPCPFPPFFFSLSRD